MIKIDKKIKTKIDIYELYSRFGYIDLINSPNKNSWDAFNDMITGIQDQFTKLLILHDQLPDFNDHDLEKYIDIISYSSKKFGLIDIYFSPEAVLELKEKGLIDYI